MASNDLRIETGDPQLLAWLKAEFLNKPGIQLAVHRFGSIRCPVCSARRQADLEWKGLTDVPLPMLGRARLVSPAAAVVRCRECEYEVDALFSWSHEQVQVVLGDVGGSVSTPKAPAAVRYYLDEAARCRDAGAPSATMAMYRAALEQLLFDEGFENGMLAWKIAQLEAVVGKDDSKRWARDLEPDVLKHIKDLGNGAIHPNGGDIEKQAAFDAELLQSVEALFEVLMESVYERPARDVEQKAKLSAKAKPFEAQPKAK